MEEICNGKYRLDFLWYDHNTSVSLLLEHHFDQFLIRLTHIIYKKNQYVYKKFVCLKNMK